MEEFRIVYELWIEAFMVVELVYRSFLVRGYACQLSLGEFFHCSRDLGEIVFLGVLCLKQVFQAGVYWNFLDEGWVDLVDFGCFMR